MEERQEWRLLGEQAGAALTLVYLPATHDELWGRIEERNQQTFDNPNTMYFSESDLRRHAGRFEVPGSDEPHLVHDGRSSSLLRALGYGDTAESAR